jgi:hypothetical protein
MSAMQRITTNYVTSGAQATVITVLGLPDILTGSWREILGTKTWTVYNNVRFEVSMAVTMKNAVFWDIKIQFVPHRRHSAAA